MIVAAAPGVGLSRDRMKDETQMLPLELLAQYRRLCEAGGAARAVSAPMSREIREQLARVEAELQTRLWLASAGPSGREATGAARSRGSISPADVARRSAEAPVHDGDLDPASASAMVYSDGACLGNPGPGGYCAIVQVPGHPERTISGKKPRTTNNEMELTAAVAGLKLAISLGAEEITVVSDSEYLVKGMTRWLRGWLRTGWKTSKGEPVKNRALWEELHSLSGGRSVAWSWVRGHVGHPENERCDAVAVAAAQEAARYG